MNEEHTIPPPPPPRASTPPPMLLHPDALDAPVSTLDTSKKHGVRAGIFKRPPPSNTDSHDLQLLVLKRSEREKTLPNHWEVPGGGVEVRPRWGTDKKTGGKAKGEVEADASIRAALAREVREETGLTVSAVVGEVEQNLFVSRKGWAWVEFDYVVRVEEEHGEEGDGEMSIEMSPDEHSEWRWVREEEADELLMVEGMRRVVGNVFAFGRRYIEYL